MGGVVHDPPSSARIPAHDRDRGTPLSVPAPPPGAIVRAHRATCGDRAFRAVHELRAEERGARAAPRRRGLRRERTLRHVCQRDDRPPARRAPRTARRSALRAAPVVHVRGVGARRDLERVDATPVRRRSGHVAARRRVRGAVVDRACRRGRRRHPAGDVRQLPRPRSLRGARAPVRRPRRRRRRGRVGLPRRRRPAVRRRVDAADRVLDARHQGVRDGRGRARLLRPHRARRRRPDDEQLRVRDAPAGDDAGSQREVERGRGAARAGEAHRARRGRRSPGRPARRLPGRAPAAAVPVVARDEAGSPVRPGARAGGDAGTARRARHRPRGSGRGARDVLQSAPRGAAVLRGPRRHADTPAHRDRRRRDRVAATVRRHRSARRRHDRSPRFSRRRRR